MAKAPAPSTEPAHEIEARKKVALAIKVIGSGQEWVLRKSQLGPADDLDCRKQTEQYSMSSMFAMLQSGSIQWVGTDILVAIIWMAERKMTGRKSLSYREVLRRFPSNDELEEYEFIPFDAVTGLRLSEEGEPLEGEVVADPEV